MKKLLYVAPHLSTGGLPQYLLRKVEELVGEFNIYLVECEDVTGGVLVVQKSKLKNMLGDKLITIPREKGKQELVNIINSISPDIIHFEELPEYFLPDSVSEEIYTSNRKYKIFETSHDSSFDKSNKRFFPDKFLVVSNYQTKMLGGLNVPVKVIEYPIDNYERPDRTDAMLKLGLDPNYKHVLNVGLFTPRKNQSEFFEYAKSFESSNVLFHCVGNTADNFKSYWEPLLKSKPNNVIIHGEKSNVSDYYAAMDLFLFTSKGFEKDKETMPLVIREAISWNIPLLIYNLPVYENYFNKFSDIKYLDFNDKDYNLKLIQSMLFDTNSNLDKNKTAIIISSYPNKQNTIQITEKCLQAIKNIGYTSILTSHYPASKSLQELSDYYIYDKHNIFTKHDYYAFAFESNDSFSMNMDIRTENNHLYHGPAVYTNYYNGISLAKSLGFENAICINYDLIIKSESLILELIELKRDKKSVYFNDKSDEGDLLKTMLFITSTEYFISSFPLVKNEDDYLNWKETVGANTLSLENIFYHNVVKNKEDINFYALNIFDDILKNAEYDLCSMAEFFNVLPVKNMDNQFAVWYSSHNTLDNREIKIKIIKNDGVFDMITLKVNNRTSNYKLYEFSKQDEFKIVLYEDGVEIRRITMDEDYFVNKLNKNGLLEIK